MYATLAHFLKLFGIVAHPETKYELWHLILDILDMESFILKLLYLFIFEIYIIVFSFLISPRFAFTSKSCYLSLLSEE